MFDASNSNNDALKRISRDSVLYYKHIEAIRNKIANYNKLERNYTYRQLFRFLQDTNTQSNTLALYICNLNKTTKIFVAKTGRKTFSQTITLSNRVIYIEKIRINYCERLKFIKQKTINKTNKLCQAFEIVSRVLVMQYKREIVDKNIKTTNKNTIVARTTI